MELKSDLLVFSHLRWDFVVQRPQQIMSRIAASRRVLFIEEPVFDTARGPWLEVMQSEENLLIVRPHSSIDAQGFAESRMSELRMLLGELPSRVGMGECVAWFYTPLALPLLSAIPHKLVVYDCMDALDGFLGASPLLRNREDELLRVADLVFTGGPSLFKRLEDRHANVHCFPSSVDQSHFASARLSVEEPSDQSEIGHPRLGYFGVIDERIDLQLIESIADLHPDWQVVMVGPVVKIDEAALPRRDNIHYLGQKQYAQLPGYLGGWDVCLLPFARNESTRYISPTKTLEYMAAEKPIVSTSITDVAIPYAHIIPIEDDPRRFADACQAALAESASCRMQRVSRMNEVLASTSWDSTVREMQSLIDSTVSSKNHLKSPQISTSGGWNADTPPILVVGAGPTGLSAAYHLGADSLLVDQNDKVGGWCRSIEQDGFVFDYAGHIMFSNDPYVHEMYKILLGDNVHWQDREAWVYSKNTYTRYPFQAALYGLPADVIKECILGAIEARYGVLNRDGATDAQSNASSTAIPDTTRPRTSQRMAVSPPVCASNSTLEGDVKDCCGDGVLESTAELVSVGSQASSASRDSSLGNGNGRHNGKHLSEREPPSSFEEFIFKVWGRGIAKHFAVPYNRKLWTVPLAEMETSWLGGRVPMPDLGEMIEGALKPVGRAMGPNARFGYPLRGGFQSLMEGFLPRLQGQLLLGKRVVAVSNARREVTFDDGQVVRYEQLISTMPLPVLIELMGEEVPQEVQQAAAGLRHVSVRCVNLGIGRENLTEKHWIYYPEETVFHRIFVQGNASPHCNPPGGFGLTCEISYSPHKPLPCDGDALVQRCIDDCRAVGIIREDDPVWTAVQVDMPFAYIVYDHARPKNVATIRQWLQSQGITLAGRYSEWEYYNSDHAFVAGRRAAEEVLAARNSRSIPGPGFGKERTTKRAASTPTGV
jgi:UDP-galactopyranose mutase